jgi:hypothetical protein
MPFSKVISREIHDLLVNGSCPKQIGKILFFKRGKVLSLPGKAHLYPVLGGLA